MFFRKKNKVTDLFVGLPDGAHISADSKDGWIVIKVNDEPIFEGTVSDSMVVYVSLMRLMGKRTAKKILKMRD